METYHGLETRIEDTEPLYRRIGQTALDTAKKGLENPYVQTGAAVGAATLTTLICSPQEGYAAQDIVPKVQETYGFFSGLWDGLLWFPNLVLDLVIDSTIAADGDGVISEPNSGPAYYLGFVLTGGAEGLLGGIIGGDD